MRTIVQRNTVLLLLAIIVAPVTAAASGGVAEINQVVVEAGLPPCDANPGFPCVIEQPGSYRLTGDLECLDPEVNIISVWTDNVTLDLNGHAILGPNACSWVAGEVTCTYENSPLGVGVWSANERVTVRNGHVVGTAGSGLQLGEHSRVEGLNVRSAGYSGISVGAGSLVRDNIVRLTRQTGIGIYRGSVAHGNVARRVRYVYVGWGSVIAETQVIESTLEGLWLHEGTVARDSISRNAGLRCLLHDAFDAVAPDTGGLVLRVSATECDGTGLQVHGVCGYASTAIEATGTTVTSGGVEIGSNICNGTTTCP